jgi:hypothetical protein
VTATSRRLSTCRLLVVASLASAVAIVSGCEVGAGGTTPSADAPGTKTARGSATGEFAWLRPAPAPPAWRRSRLSSGATIAYPPAWRALRGDSGTASAAELDATGRYLGYLNLTPRQGAETLAGWASFRLRHNAEEGDVRVRADGNASGLRFRTGRGTCVQDTYSTSAAATYEEVACLVAGRHASSVIVGAAPRERWSRERAVIERAISAMTT